MPYTIIETSIYMSFADSFVKESSAMNLTLTKVVKPFKFCYLAKDIASTRLGLVVPVIDLVIGSESVQWRIFGSNSMVRVTNKVVDVWCLGFTDGGDNLRTPIVIGVDNNLLQFDLESNKLGFSSSFHIKGTTCSNFNFTYVTNY